MRVLNRFDTVQALPMVEAIAAMREAFGALHTGQATIPERSHLQLGGLTALTMPGVVTSPPRVGAKLITVVPDNVHYQRPVIQGVVVLFDAVSGAVRGLLDGQALTALRTGAVSGLATDLLAREDATCLAMLGSGPQADTQVEAVCCVRPIDRVLVYSRTRDHAEACAVRIRVKAAALGDVAVSVAGSVAAALERADVVCTATRSVEPIVRALHVRGGTHINAVGSYTPAMKEVDASVLANARIVVDDVDAAMSEAGELIDAVSSGVLQRERINSLGALVHGDAPSRLSTGEITVFKSVGLAVQDICAAGRALDRAQQLGLGTEVTL